MFCPKCENLFEYKEDFEKKELYHYCDSCDIKHPIEDFCIYTKTYNFKKEDNTNYVLLSNDKTLPKQKSVVCPKCNKNNISYTNKDNIVYICCDCKFYWRKK